MVHIDYVEWRSGDLERSKVFFASAFGWRFTDYGPAYSAFNEGLDGGIAEGEVECPLIILKADDLAAARTAVLDAGGEIAQEIYAFPGGRRFHFREPGGAELAVWSEN